MRRAAVGLLLEVRSTREEVILGGNGIDWIVETLGDQLYLGRARTD
jgi:hypothetical protein